MKYTEKEIYNEIVSGIKKFSKDTGIKKVVIGLSGGIDCAVVAEMAVKALGSKNVYGVALPSRYTSKDSMTLAKKLAQNLKIDFRAISIDAAFGALLSALGGAKKLKPLTVQNLQPRLRANILMAISAEVSGAVLATGNRSEIASGYYTLYGDSAGALAPIAGIYKQMVYKIARYINRNGEIIPKLTITRPPTAELAHNQKDEDDLTPYKTLDKILSLWLDCNKTPAQIVKLLNTDLQTVKKVEQRYKKNLFKLKQTAPPLKLKRACPVDL